jgi:hypothetical protein
MDKKEILKELREKFDEIKKNLKFKATFQEINEMSYIEDMALRDGYVSNQFSRQMINRMVETFVSWIPELNVLIFPAPYDLIRLNESKILTQQEKNEITEIISRIFYIYRKHKRIAFEDLKGEGEFVDELVNFDKAYFNPFMLKYHKKLEKFWRENSSKNTDK